jgi:hypothetical protein
MNNNEIISNNSNEIINTEITMNNNEIPATTNSTYTVLIANKSGHTTMADLDIEQTIENVAELVEKKKNWVFINGVPFEFAGSNVRSEANMSKLRTQLEQNPMAQIMMTGQVIGGQE